MAQGITFVGEFEFVDNVENQPGLGDFANLADVQRIRDLTSEFTGKIEMMPYQKAGDTIKLPVAVYVQPTYSNGKVIVVLTRDEYPSDLSGVKPIVEKAIQRIDSLYSMTNKYREDSIDAAKQTLLQLRDKAASL